MTSMDIYNIYDTYDIYNIYNFHNIECKISYILKWFVTFVP